jgi:hypothetical protein
MFISFTVNPALLPFETRRQAWIEAREEARLAYRAWAEAQEPDRAGAFAVYRAAEEREEAAARVFRPAGAAAWAQARPPVTVGGSPCPLASSCWAP